MREAGSRPIITNSVYSYLNSFWNQYCGGVTIGTVLFIYLFIFIGTVLRGYRGRLLGISK